MRNFVKFALILFSFCGNATANEQQFKPLENILKQESSPVMLVYAYERCSGLFGAVYGQFNSSERDKAKDIAAQALSRSVDSGLAAVELGKIHKLDVSASDSQISSVEFMKIYESQIKAHWQKTGNIFSEAFLADQNVCQNLLAEKQAVFSSLIEVNSPSNVWLNVAGFLKSEFKDQSPTACQMETVMRTEEGPFVFFSKMFVFSKELGGVGVLLGAALKKQSGEVLPFQGFSRNTSTKFSDWEYNQENGAFALTGSQATQYLKEYNDVVMRFSGWVLEKNTFDPKRDFIFLKFQKGNDVYHAPLFLGDGETKFSVCITKSLNKLLSELR